MQQILLLIVAYFVASTIALSADTKTDISTLELASYHSTVAVHHAANGRLLRAAKETTTEDENAEDRGLWSSIKVRWWLEWEKSDDHVKKALKLSGLEGAALMNHKNYQTYMKFFKKAEEYRVNKWYRKRFPTFKVWNEQGLGKVTQANQLEAIKKTENFRVYKHYVNYFDDAVLRTIKAGYPPPSMVFAKGSTEAETTARTVIMAEAGRSVDYAKLALGMVDETYPRVVLMKAAQQIESSVDFKYFQLFLKTKKPMLLKEEATLTSLQYLTSKQSKRLKEVQDELELVKKYVPTKPTR